MRKIFLFAFLSPSIVFAEPQKNSLDFVSLEPIEWLDKSDLPILGQLCPIDTDHPQKTTDCRKNALRPIKKSLSLYESPSSDSKKAGTFEVTIIPAAGLRGVVMTDSEPPLSLSPNLIPNHGAFSYHVRETAGKNKEWLRIWIPSEKNPERTFWISPSTEWQENGAPLRTWSIQPNELLELRSQGKIVILKIDSDDISYRKEVKADRECKTNPEIFETMTLKRSELFDKKGQIQIIQRDLPFCEDFRP